MSPAVEYPLAITDMDGVCQAKHGRSRSYLPSVLATEHPTLPRRAVVTNSPNAEID
jgi:hypothetical protein